MQMNQLDSTEADVMIRSVNLTTNWRQYYQGYGNQRPYVFGKDIYT
jgi:hypothetical protein